MDSLLSISMQKTVQTKQTSAEWTTRRILHYHNLSVPPAASGQRSEVVCEVLPHHRRQGGSKLRAGTVLAQSHGTDSLTRFIIVQLSESWSLGAHRLQRMQYASFVVRTICVQYPSCAAVTGGLFADHSLSYPLPFNSDFPSSSSS